MAVMPLGADVWDQQIVRSQCCGAVDQLCVDGERSQPFLAGRALLRSLIQQLGESSNLTENYLLSSIAVWCASAVVCDADDELLAEHLETPTENETLELSFAHLYHRLWYRLESCLAQNVRGNQPESVSLSQFKQASRKLGPNTVSGGSNFVPISLETVALDVEFSAHPDGTGMPEDDSDTEGSHQPALPNADARCRQDATLSSEAIVQWMRGCTPASSEYCGGTSTGSSSTTQSSLQASTSFSALSLATSAKSQGMGGRAQLLLDNCISAIASLSHAIESAEYVMVVQLAGASGVCRAVVKSLASLASKIPAAKLSIQVVCMPGLRGISRMLAGMAVLPSLAHNKRTCPWSALFKSSQVPRASLFASASGKVVCEDALQEVQKRDAAQTFPWIRSSWPDVFHDSIMRHSRGDLTRDCLELKTVILFHVQPASERPFGFSDLLGMWIAMYVPKDAICCYTSPDGQQLARCGHLLYLDYEELEAVQEVREGDNCCMLFSPVCRHLLMVLDLQALGVSAPAWCIPDCTLRSTVRDFDTLTYKRLHTTHALIMMSLNEDSDSQLRSVFAKAVPLFYSLEQQVPHVQPAQDIEPVMYCFASYASPSTPAYIKHFLEDAASQPFEADDVCAILSVSIPNMAISQITFEQLPGLDFIRGVVESHFQGDLSVHHLHRRRSTWSM